MSLFRAIEQAGIEFSRFGESLASSIPKQKRESARNALIVISVTTLATAKLCNGNFYSLIPFGIGLVTGLVGYKLHQVTKLQKSPLTRQPSIRAVTPPPSSIIGSLRHLPRD